MSRHNRRRTRASHRNASPLTQPLTFGLPDIVSVALPSSCQHVATTSSSQMSPKRHDISARHWHNRYIAWLARERRHREEREKLMEDQKRIFGGENEEEDTDGLCSSMMEYFVGYV
ncbi:MAG: hypothetical protein Q9169_005322 [Polycauliona sp. 2 TL-2023]